MVDELHELPDLGDLDENEQTREVYAWAGLALYYAQVLEHGIANLIHIVLGVEGTLAQHFTTTDEFYEVQFRKTLGTLKKDAQNTGALTAQVEKALQEVVRRRNFLVHDFFKARAELFFHQEGRRLMLEELRNATELFISVDKAIDAIMFARGEPSGITRERVNELAEELRRSAEPGS